MKLFVLRFCLFIFREMGKGGRKREWNIHVWLPLLWPSLGIWPATQTCALTGNQTGDALVRRPGNYEIIWNKNLHPLIVNCGFCCKFMVLWDESYYLHEAIKINKSSIQIWIKALFLRPPKESFVHACTWSLEEPPQDVPHWYADYFELKAKLVSGSREISAPNP